MTLKLPVILLAVLSIALSDASAQSCVFSDGKTYRTAPNLESVPAAYRASAQCSRPKLSVDQYKGALKAQGMKAPTPEDVRLDGNLRRTTIHTSLGDVHIRWPRSVEDYFGKTPERAVQQAWRAAARALAQNSFPTRLRTVQYDWNIVFMDNVPAGQDISMGGCHPAWMRPPADIFVAGRRLASQCGPTPMPVGRASQQLAETLLHELGHAVEFQFMGDAFLLKQRWHNEGFATWFETLGSGYLQGASNVTRSKMRTRAASAFHPGWSPRIFRGSSEDYARSYAMVAALVDKGSILRLADTYKRMERDQVPLLQAVQREFGWNERQWVEQTAKMLGIE